MTAAKPKHLHKRPGRPSLLTDGDVRRGYRFALLGMTNEQMAAAFGVSVRTFYNHCRRCPEFLQAIKAGGEIADGEVVEALRRRAVGYSHPVTKLVVVAGPRGEGARIERIETVRHYPPDTAAAIYWLTNRQPGRWRSNVAQAVGAADKGSVVVKWLPCMPADGAVAGAR